MNDVRALDLAPLVTRNPRLVRLSTVVVVGTPTGRSGPGTFGCRRGMSVPRLKESMHHHRLRLLSFALVVACGCGGAAPVEVTLPKPGGEFAVGYTTLSVEGTSAWYPAQAGTGRGERGYGGGLMRALFGLSLEDLARIHVPGEVGAEPVAGAHPLLVFEPGGSSLADLSTSLAQELASQGYVVMLVQPNPFEESGENSGTEAPNEVDGERLVRSLVARRQKLFTDAIDLASDPLTTELVGEIDVDRIAVAGHSAGGSTAMDLALIDDRVAAAIDLDGALFGDARTTATPVPSLVVMAEMAGIADSTPSDGEEPTITIGRESVAFLRTAPNTVIVTLEEAGHFAVLDTPLLLPALPEALRADAADSVGAIGEEATAITNTIVVRFLNAALNEDRLATAAELSDGLAHTTP
jgi:dienelactone hydrolase